MDNSYHTQRDFRGNEIKPVTVHRSSNAILHVDGDCFFASVEQMRNPSLLGKPVTTGTERGIASAMSYEAKACGVTRAMSLPEIKKICPDVVLLPSDYELYSVLAMRMYKIIERYSPVVEEYSIDECFADLSGMRRPLNMSYPQMLEKIQQDLELELGVTFSIGLAPNKTLAKIASKWKKPHGMTWITAKRAHLYLARTPIGDVWHIGKQTAHFLKKHGIRTAYDFAMMSEEWVEKWCDKPQRDIYHELNCRMVKPLNEEKKKPKSVNKFKTFTADIKYQKDVNYVFGQLSKNIENACIKMRRHGVVTDTFKYVLKNNHFKYQSYKFVLKHKTNSPTALISAIEPFFRENFKTSVGIRQTGIKAYNTEPVSGQLDLFSERAEIEHVERIFDCVDDMQKRYGKHTLRIGTSMLAKTNAGMNQRDSRPERYSTGLIKGESFRKRLNIPFLGLCY